MAMLSRRLTSRRTEAKKIRDEATDTAFSRPHPDHISNGEESQYRRPLPPISNGELSYVANYSKALPHNGLGEVVPSAYRGLLRALNSGNPEDFARVQLGTGEVKLTNPQAGLAFDLEGADAQSVTMPPAPRLDSAENASEMAELYWMALLRDVSFVDYGTGAGTDVGPDDTAAAANSLTNDFSIFTGPPRDPFTADPAAGPVTPATLFRGFTPGDLVGPYVSQFLLKGTVDPVVNPGPDNGLIRYGALTINQRMRTAQPGVDYLIAFPDWLAVQRGEDRRDTDAFEAMPHFARNLRDLATYVHFDALYEAFLNACLLLLSMPARFDPGNPYYVDPLLPAQPPAQQARTQEGFGTFGGPHVLTLLAEVATRVLKAEWFQKWGVHRRLRPEEFGGRIHVHRHVAPGRYPMINPEILDTTPSVGGVPRVLPRVEARFGSALLPQAFPEGCPTHPSYGAGHASVSGACVTILKAWFDESDVFDPNAVSLPTDPVREAQLQENRRAKVPDAAGNALVDYVPPANEPPLTVGGELNKLAGNIAIARNGAGVHWRTDYSHSLLLGEDIAIRLLQEQKLTYSEDHFFSLTRFDGTGITI
jgi:hypothetical protein